MARRSLGDDQWERIKPLLPGTVGDRGVSGDNRLFVETVLWRLRTGAPWRGFPPEFGRRHSVHARFARCRKNGVRDRLLEVARADGDLEEVFVDRTAVRPHLHAAGAARNRRRRTGPIS